MASFNSNDFLRLVRDFGEPLTLTKATTAGAYNPASGSIEGSATTDYSCTGYFYNYQYGTVPTLDEVVRGDRRCVISALDLPVEPDDGDLISGNRDDVRVHRVTTIYSAGSKVCYICYVRE